MNRVVVWILGALLGAVLLGGALWVGAAALLGSSDDASGVRADHEYVVPAGTAERAAAGEVVDLMPAEIVVRVGETLRIRNDDSYLAMVGPFVVGPGETLTHRFTEPGVIEGFCSLNAEGYFAVRVIPA